MHAHDPAEAVEVLNRLLKFFGDGERWIKGRLSDRRGKCCLVGALDFVSSHHAITGDAAEQYRPLPLPTRLLPPLNAPPPSPPVFPARMELVIESVP